ncbi:uncharacterized protein LOC110841329 isoform X2 [Zootermopsis nevadensis]|uniref:uncharacterized protein LOC110841329 isoform X2 n=1 Tax=Zootermopsis nevadensis TaxID=136037 RepID=UPI000B8E7C76|nr:uncharacterized protein LOC110841329 isoform X2 [Zootermopsis nevadensis]
MCGMKTHSGLRSSITCNCSTEQSGHTQSRKAVRMKRHHKKMVEAYRNFESIFQNVQLELQNSVACGDAVEEVVLLIGATSRSPREVYRIVIPPVSCVESDQKQSENRIRLNLLRCVVLSEDLTDMLDRSIGLTNMYVMLKKRRGTSSHWFVPDDSYGLPLRGRQAVIFLGEQVGRRVDTDAVCKEVAKPRTPDTSKTVEAETNLDGQRGPLLELIDGLHINPRGTQWFQSRVCLKGFRLVCL